MRSSSVRILLGCLSLALAGCVQQAAVTGNWTLAVDLGGQPGGEVAFVFEEGADGALTGTYTGVLGTQELTGTVGDGAIEFSFDSQAGRISYQGTVAEDSMQGTVEYGLLGNGTFTGARQNTPE